jgi:hypothetical protein
MYRDILSVFIISALFADLMIQNYHQRQEKNSPITFNPANLYLIWTASRLSWAGPYFQKNLKTAPRSHWPNVSSS